VPELTPRLIDAAALPTSSNGAPRIVVLQAITPDVSSTEIRRRVAAGESLTGLTSSAVIRHIARHGLYRVHSRAMSDET